MYIYILNDNIQCLIFRSIIGVIRYNNLFKIKNFLYCECFIVGMHFLFFQKKVFALK